ncbi:MAG: DUF3168 domain-containing protein [Paracoccaceae bacterium]
MSYGVAAALQAALITRLQSSAEVTVPVFDASVFGEMPETYVQLGSEEARARNDKTGRGAEHRVSISVVTSLPGFAAAKAQAVAVSDALDGADLPLSRGRLVDIWFERAVARRDEGEGHTRRVDLRFHARVEDN